MSRTRKGSKGPGWEPWSNLHEKQKQAAESRADPTHFISQDELEDGCTPNFPCAMCREEIGNAQ